MKKEKLILYKGVPLPKGKNSGKIWALPVYASGKKKGQLKHTRFGLLGGVDKQGK